MRSYTCAPASFAPGAAKTLIEVLSGTNRAFRLKHINISSADVAGATNVRVNITLITATGTGTALAPAPDMSDDTAFTGTAKSNDTVEPTKSTVLKRRRWNIITECDIPCEGKQFTFKAGGAEGFNIELLDNPAVAIIVEAEIEEL